MNIFLDATIAIPNWEFFDCYKISNLSSPVVQSMLHNLEEDDILKIKNIGILIVKDIGYGKGGSITIMCKKLRRK